MRLRGMKSGYHEPDRPGQAQRDAAHHGEIIRGRRRLDVHIGPSLAKEPIDRLDGGSKGGILVLGVGPPCRARPMLGRLRIRRKRRQKSDPSRKHHRQK